MIPSFSQFESIWCCFYCCHTNLFIFFFAFSTHSLSLFCSRESHASHLQYKCWKWFWGKCEFHGLTGLLVVQCQYVCIYFICISTHSYRDREMKNSHRAPETDENERWKGANQKNEINVVTLWSLVTISVQFIFPRFFYCSYHSPLHPFPLLRSRFLSIF